MTGTVLILGGSGRFGRNAAEAFWNAGWHVKLFDREADDLMQAAQSADIIVNGWNPAYPDWQAQTPRLTEKVISAAEASGATIVLPGNVYVFGPNAPARFSQSTPHAATNPLGKLRIEMEQRYQASDARVILLRMGDFIDTEASGNWFDRIMAPPLAKGCLTYPGRLDARHSWAFLPDAVRAVVALCNKRAFLPRFADIPFPGYTLTGHELADLCGEALGRPVAARKMSWLPIRVARPVWRLASPLLEMRYLWDKPHFLDATQFDAELPGFPVTPPGKALAQAIAPVLNEMPKDRPRRGGADRHPVPAP